MTCFNPRKIWLRKDFPINFNELSESEQKALKRPHFKPYPNCYIQEIPCGKCLGCRLDHANEWATRITLEAKNWKKNCFVTLTYNDKHLPENKTLIKKDLSDFMKRLRFHEKGFEQWENPNTKKIENPIRFFACGEYGGKLGRPHYHAALFNYMPDDLKIYKTNFQNDVLYTSKKLQEIWGKGFVVIGNLSHQSANYIARYVQKKAYHDQPTKVKVWNKKENKFEFKQLLDKNRRIPEFLQMSRGVGIGKIYWENKKENLKNNLNILLKIQDKVKFKPLPRYFLKQWEKEEPDTLDMAKFKKKKASEIRKNEIMTQKEQFELPNLNHNIKENIDFNKWKYHLKKEEEILKNKGKLLKRNNFI